MFSPAFTTRENSLSWRRDRSAAERFKLLSQAGGAGARHRIVRVVRDYGMFDRRESPQYYPAIDARPAELLLAVTPLRPITTLSGDLLSIYR
jgi:hypothetical protein